MSFKILQVPRKREDAQSYIKQYKAFRLLSLKISPKSFHSTYEKEIQFTDDIWLGRLTNPNSGTFVALQSGQIVCTLTLIGPLDYAPDDLYPSTHPLELDGGPPQPFSHWRFNGMFTLPVARGQGVATTLISRALKYAETRAAESGKDFIGSIVTESDNIAAMSLYGKCGFSIIKKQPFHARGEEKVEVIIMQYFPLDSEETRT